MKDVRGSARWDVRPTVMDVMVHIWSWMNCLASEFRRQASETSQVQVHELDEHLEEIGFGEH